MIVFRQPDEITDWRVVFMPVGKYWWARFVPGRFKHVAAFGYSHACRTWVIYDVTLAGTRVYVLPDGAAGLEVLGDWLAGCTIVSLQTTGKSRSLRESFVASITCRIGFYCVTAVRHLIRAGCGAITPTGLYRALISQGAEIIADGVECRTSGS